ncbi:MAG: hypothetical protein HY951_05780, partial [Bacteroidia bacterium]|nr:hypothetical protein [Bacteroidia bacterium]
MKLSINNLLFFNMILRKMLFSCLFCMVLNAQSATHFTELFNDITFNTTSYTSGTITLTSGSWDYDNIKGEISANSYGAIGGAARLNKLITAGSFLITPSVNSVGTVSFYYRELNSGGGTITIQKSINGGAFTTIGTQSFSGTTYSLYSLNVNDASNNIRIKILSINNTGFLILDNITLTDFVVGPALLANPTQLTGFNYIVGSGPSASQSFNLTGSNLTGSPGNILISAPSNYEVSLDNITFLPTISLPYSGTTISSTPIYTRLKSGLSVNNYNLELVSITGGGAPQIDVSLSGSVSAVPTPILNVNPITLSGFTYIFGSGPSTSQSYNISGSYLTGYPSNIVITASTNYEVSLNNSTFANTINIPFTSASLASTTVFVRLIS